MTSSIQKQHTITFKTLKKKKKQQQNTNKNKEQSSRYSLFDNERMNLWIENILRFLTVLLLGCVDSIQPRCDCLLSSVIHTLKWRLEHARYLLQSRRERKAAGLIANCNKLSGGADSRGTLADPLGVQRLT